MGEGQVKQESADLFTSCSISPVWHEGILWTSEHRANVGGMLFGRVEIRVVT